MTAVNSAQSGCCGEGLIMATQSIIDGVTIVSVGYVEINSWVEASILFIGFYMRVSMEVVP